MAALVAVAVAVVSLAAVEGALTMRRTFLDVGSISITDPSVR